MRTPTSLAQCRSVADCDIYRSVLVDEARDLTSPERTDDLAGDDLERFDAIDAELELLGKRRDRLGRIERTVSTSTGEAGDSAPQDRGRLNRSESNPWTAERSGQDPAGAARTALELLAKRDTVPEHAIERAATLIDRETRPVERNLISEWALRSSNPAYESAFSKLVAHGDAGMARFSEDEERAFGAVQHYRAMSLTGGAGGYMVPFTLDPAIMLTSNGSVNPLRQISRIVQTPTNSWNGITSAGVTGSWDDEAEEVSDDSPTLAQKPIPVTGGKIFVPYSFELGMDAPGLLEGLRTVMLDEAEQMQATAYTTGVGTSEPKGIITALDGTASEVAPSVAETFSDADVYKTQEALPSRWQAGAQWAANLSTLNVIDQFETTNGAKMFPDVGTGRLLRKPANELSNMAPASGINGAATADNLILLYGDFKQFIIVDRLGTTVELVQNLFGPNHRPTGQRGVFMWFRTGSDVSTIKAFRLLNVATAA